MARPLKPFIRGGGYYPSRKWTPLVYPGGYTTANGGEQPEPEAVLKTVTGSLIHVTNALALPAEALSVNVEPIQDLHGYDNPWPAGGGKNKMPPPTSISQPIHGTATDNNGKISISTDGNSATFEVYIPSFTFAESSQKIEMLNSFTGATIYFFNGTTQVDYFSMSKQNRVINSASMTALLGKTIDRYRLTINAQSLTGGTFGLMVTPESDPALTTFSPYSNICPISGRTSATIYRSGADTSDPTTYTIQLGDTVYGGTLDVTGGKMLVDSELEVFNKISDNGIYSQINYFVSDGAGVGTTGDYTRIPFTIRAGADQSKYNRMSSTYKYKMCNLAKHSFAYNEKSTHWYRNTVLYLFLPTALVGSTAQSVYDYLVSIKDTTPLSFWIPLASPIEITLTPTQIDMLLGENNLWADAGDSTLTYYAEGEASTSEALGILLGGTYNNPGGADDVSDDEALGILLGGS